LCMRKLRLLSVQPATTYYAWQIEVFLTRTIEQGYNPNFIDVVGAFEHSIDQSWLVLQQAFPAVRFFFYKDTRENKRYSPSLQSHILRKHWIRYPELKGDSIFFHDADFIFTRFFDFTPYLQDKKWYFSNCDSYLGADYLESKGSHPTRTMRDGRPEMLLDGMATVLGMCSCTVRAHRGKSGGAQKLIKNVTHAYWEEVENDANNLYDWLLKNKDEYGDEKINSIQIWTTSMWSELWNAWKRGVTVEIPEAFDFAWATCHISRWDERSFFHNAGVQHANQDMFFKAAYIDSLPYGEDLEVSKERCSKMYYDYTQEVGKKSVLI